MSTEPGRSAAHLPPGPHRQVYAVRDLLIALFGTRLTGVYLHGSAVTSGLRPHSDVDILAILSGPMVNAERGLLLDQLLALSARHPALADGPRCLEVMVFLTDELTRPDNDATCTFTYGEWLRAGFEAGDIPRPTRDPGHTLILAQARSEAQALLGPALAELLPAIPASRIRTTIRDALPSLMDNLRDDERNVLLTLARMWVTLDQGHFVAKDEAAAWAISQMLASEAATLALARRAYRGEEHDVWTGDASPAIQAAKFLAARIAERT